LFQTLFETATLLLNEGDIRRRWQRWWRFFLVLFVIDVFGHAIEKQRGLAVVVFDEPINLRRHDVDRLVREVLDVTATAAGEDSDQAESDVFVLLAGPVAVRVQPAQ